MRLKYSLSDSSQNEFDSLPRLTFLLGLNNPDLEVTGLVDSGATVNVLPYEIGIQLGAKWDDNQTQFQLAGSLNNLPAMPLVLTAKIGSYAPVRLAFAWVKRDIPLILGQTNFFMEFDVFFYRSILEFEITPK